MKNLTGYFLDKRMNVLGLVSSTIPNALRLESDNEFESIEEGTTIFEGVVSYYGADEAGSDFVKVGNYFLYEDEDGISKAYTIIDTEKDRKRNEISFYAEDAGLSLLNSYTFPYEAVKDMNIASYFELFLKGSGFEVGTNELGDAYSRKLKWEGNATITERLLSVATQFDHADINFSFVVKGMRVTEKYVNIYKKRGIATNVTLQLNREIDNIITSESIKNLATSVLAKGGTPEGKDKPITLKGYVPKVPDERFFIEGEFLRDRDSNEIWSSFLSEGEGAKGGYIEKPFDYDTLSKEELYNRSVNHLKRVSQIEQNFEVDIALLPDNVRIGDTIQIVDQEDNLYLQARVLKMEKSRSLDKYVATLGEYLIKESGINQRLQELADRIAAIPRGATDYLWIRYADDNKGNGFSAIPTNKAYIAIKHALNQPIPSDDPKDYEGLWVLIQGEKGIPGEPGDDGLPTYTWIRYADNVAGGGISANPEGKMYIGFAHNKPTPEPSNIPKDYAWSAMYDEAKMLELNEKVSVIEEQTNEISESLDLLVVPVMQPDRPIAKEGMVWWKTDVKGDVIGIEKYIGGKWEKQIIQQDTLNIINLNAVKITGSEITGTEIAGSTIISTFDEELVPGSPVKRRGTLKLDKGILASDFEYYNINKPSLVTAKGNVKVSGDGLQTSMYDAQGKLTSGSQYSDVGISINKPSMPYGSVNLRYNDLIAIPETAFTSSMYESGFAEYSSADNRQPRYSRDGRMVQITGVIRNNIIVNSGAPTVKMATLPKGVRPKSEVGFVLQGSGMNRFMLTVRPDGTLGFSRYGITAYTDVPVGTFITVTCIYVAGD